MDIALLPSGKGAGWVDLRETVKGEHSVDKGDKREGDGREGDGRLSVKMPNDTRVLIALCLLRHIDGFLDIAGRTGT